MRPRSADVRDVAWTEADLALIDEADALLGAPEAARARRRRAARRGGDDAAARVVAELGVGGFVTAAEVARRYGGRRGAGADDGDEPRTFGARARRRGPGPVADAVADARPALPVGLDDGRRRLRSGEPRRAGARAGTTCSSSSHPTARPTRRARWSRSPSTTARRPRSWRSRTACWRPRRPVSSRRVRCGTPASTRVRARRRDELVGVRPSRPRVPPPRDEGTVAVIAPDDLHDELVAALADVGRRRRLGRRARRADRGAGRASRPRASSSTT